MTFQDIFKSSFLENVTSVSLLDMSVALLLAFGIGLFIFLVYKKTFTGVMYSSSFGVTLLALTMITTLVILAVTSNVVLSLGAVLPKLEYQMMETLMCNQGVYLSSEDLLIKVWGYETDAELGTVWVYISYLRKRLHELNAKERIQAKRNIGYRLEV